MSKPELDLMKRFSPALAKAVFGYSTADGKSPVVTMAFDDWSKMVKETEDWKHIAEELFIALKLLQKRRGVYMDDIEMVLNALEGYEAQTQKQAPIDDQVF